MLAHLSFLCFKAVTTIPHSSSEDLIISGHVIPKDTMISPFVSSVHMDPELFPNPDEFRPERFYDEKTGNVINKDTILPFSLGSLSIFQSPKI